MAHDCSTVSRLLTQILRYVLFYSFCQIAQVCLFEGLTYHSLVQFYVPLRHTVAVCFRHFRYLLAGLALETFLDQPLTNKLLG